MKYFIYCATIQPCYNPNTRLSFMMFPDHFRLRILASAEKQEIE